MAFRTHPIDNADGVGVQWQGIDGGVVMKNIVGTALIMFGVFYFWNFYQTIQDLENARSLNEIGVLLDHAPTEDEFRNGSLKSLAAIVGGLIIIFAVPD